MLLLLLQTSFDVAHGASFGGSSWRLDRFSDADIVAEMVSLSRNKCLRPLLRFVMVRSNHGEKPLRISLSPEMMYISLGSDRLGSISLLHWWQKEEGEICKKEEEPFVVE
jgi:hypothetical protein